MLKSYQVNNYNFESISQLNDNLQYLDYLKKNIEFKTISINNALAYRYQGNLFGLLKELGISSDLFLYTMYINDFSNPVEFDGNKYILKIPIKPPIPVS